MRGLQKLPQTKNFSETFASTEPYFTRREAAIIIASKFIRERDVVFVGQGLPVIAALFAKKSKAKQSIIMNEYGIVDTDPPIAVELAHPLFAETATYLCDMIDALACLIYHVDVAFLGAAQIDKYGNINTTTIGDYFNPKFRISGSGGANDIGSLARKVIVIMDNQNASKFPERVDYLTTPGFFRGPRSERKRLSLLGGGPEIVVTDLGIYRFSKKTGEMYLDSLQSCVTIDEVMENTGWCIKTAKRVGVQQPPTRDEINLLRSLDPRMVYLRGISKIMNE
jgi:glutaconate CoA-transferase subunit B